MKAGSHAWWARPAQNLPDRQQHHSVDDNTASAGTYQMAGLVDQK